ncbi:hypothetical protein [Methylobacterium pseudosasicola]|uniref:hypothetical protein n=1 Tax=Methylobacterium pseudosasicola TaxID=582667 RepID=UPI001428AECA
MILPPQLHAWLAAVGELNTSSFEGALDRFGISRRDPQRTVLKFGPAHRRDTDTGSVCNLLSRPAQKGASRSQLTSCDFQNIT